MADSATATTPGGRWRGRFRFSLSTALITACYVFEVASLILASRHIVAAARALYLIPYVLLPVAALVTVVFYIMRRRRQYLIELIAIAVFCLLLVFGMNA